MVNEWLPRFRPPHTIRLEAQFVGLRTNHVDCRHCTLRLGDLWAMLWITMYKR
jgi:hypothetical protein